MTDVYKDERDKASFKVENMALHIYGGAKHLNEFKEYQQAIADDPILRFNPEQLDLNRKDLFETFCKKALRYHELFNQSLNPMNEYCDLMFDEPLVGAVHHFMFVPTLRLLASDEQQKRWLNEALQMKIIGCYAQTELAHGSDIQGLQTTATFDPATDSFVLHTPSIEGAKWWAGELGLVANHAIVFAQLIIEESNYGIQPFMVQLRDMKTHKPLPGIDVGDIGPKYGYNAKDNGFLLLNKVRIPREDMLNRYATVTKEGDFVPAGNPRIVYATMMRVRLGILKHSYLFLSAQLAITTRYSVLRKQFKDQNGIERTILDYQTQQEKILPLMADVYAMKFSYGKSHQLLEDNLQRCLKQDFSQLQDLHGLLSAHKSVSTTITLHGMEKLRQACGGHGFSSYSGLVGRLKTWYPYSTLEGENTIMLLQTAKYLVKMYGQVLKGKVIRSNQCEYLRDHKSLLSSKCSIDNIREFLLLEPLRQILRFITCFSVAKAQKVITNASTSLNISVKEAIDTKASSVLCQAAVAHTYYYIYNAFFESIVTLSDESLRQVLTKLCVLFGLSKILEKSNAAYEGGYLSGEQLKLLREAREVILLDLRPEALSLAEAWSYHDNALRSAIGNSKGDIYETLLDWAQNKNPINKPETQAALHETIKPIVGKVYPPSL